MTVLVLFHSLHMCMGHGHAFLAEQAPAHYTSAPILDFFSLEETPPRIQIFVQWTFLNSMHYDTSFHGMFVEILLSTGVSGCYVHDSPQRGNLLTALLRPSSGRDIHGNNLRKSKK